jgi:hypothetical protein
LIDYFGFAIWWCCLNSWERTASQLLLARVALLQGFITVEDYELMWLGIGDNPALKRAGQYQQSYYLVPGVYDPSGEDPVDVYYFAEGFWFPFLAFYVSPDADCSDGCKVLNFP